MRCPTPLVSQWTPAALRLAAAAAFVAGLTLPAAASAADPGSFLSGPSAGDAFEIADTFLSEHRANLGLEAADLAEVAVESRYRSAHTGVTHLALRQRHLGIGVHGAVLTVNVARDGSVINVGNRFLSGLARRVEGAVEPAFDAAKALTLVADRLGLEPHRPLERIAAAVAPGGVTRFADAGISRVEIPVRLVWQPVADRVRLAWEVAIHERRSDDHWFVRVDAASGKELDRDNLTIYDEFRPRKGSSPAPAALSAPFAACGAGGDGSDDYCVYAMPVESPHYASATPDGSERTVESDPWLASSTASPLGWNDTNGVAGAEFNTTQGNNVNAQKAGAEADGGANRVFNFDLDLTASPTVGSNVDAAIVNLYFWNNILHDLWGDYGFDEAAGNFQELNYSALGAGSDSVIANAQATGNCNANMGTPADGGNPTMNMFTCDIASPARDGDLDNGVIAHEYFHGVSNRLTGGPASVGCLNNDEQAGEGWSDLAGLLMTIEPGDAGTDARGIGTWLLGEGPSGAGVRSQRYSTDVGVNDHTYEDIKSAAIPHGVGEVWASIVWEAVWALIDEHGFNPDPYGDWTTGGNNLAMQLLVDGLKLQPCSPGFVDARDAILTADQVLTGGANECLLWEAFAKRGLGWSAIQGSSDSVTDGTESFDQPAGCEFLSAVPTSAEVCAGADAGYTIQLGDAWVPPVTLSVVSPPAGTGSSFTVNPVLAAPGATDLTITGTGGLGSSTSNFMLHGADAGQTFDLPLQLVSFAAGPGAPTLTAPADLATGVPSQPLLEWSAGANGGRFEVQVATDAGFTELVATASGVEGTSWQVAPPLVGGRTHFWRVRAINPCGTGAFSEAFEFTTAVGPGDCAIGVATVSLLDDGFESGAPGWTTGGTGSTWALSGAEVHSGAFAFHADNPSTVSDQYLISPAVALPGGASPLSARFWTRQELEDRASGCYDGAVAEISTDGATWTRLESEILVTPYDGPVSDGFDNPIGGSDAWCGDPREWEEVVIDLDAWAGESVQLRIRLATDNLVGHPGMEVDDVSIRSCADPGIFDDGFESGDTSAWSDAVPPPF